jgi:hypothetical protein
VVSTPAPAPLEKFAGLVEGFFAYGGTVISIVDGGPELAHVIAEIDRFYGSVRFSHKDPVTKSFPLEGRIRALRKEFPGGRLEAEALDTFLEHIGTQGELLPEGFGNALSFLISAVRDHIDTGGHLTAAFGPDGTLGALATTSGFGERNKVDFLASTGWHHGAGAAALALAIMGDNQGVCLNSVEGATSYYEKLGFEHVDEEWVNMALGIEQVDEVRGRVVASLMGTRSGTPSDAGLGIA